MPSGGSGRRLNCTSCSSTSLQCAGLFVAKVVVRADIGIEPGAIAIDTELADQAMRGEQVQGVVDRGFGDRAPSRRNASAICSADRCCGADSRMLAIRSRCSVMRMPQAESLRGDLGAAGFGVGNFRAHDLQYSATCGAAVSAAAVT